MRRYAAVSNVLPASSLENTGRTIIRPIEQARCPLPSDGAAGKWSESPFVQWADIPICLSLSFESSLHAILPGPQARILPQAIICPFHTNVRTEADVNRQRCAWRAYALVAVDAGWCRPLIPMRTARALASPRNQGPLWLGEIADGSSFQKAAMRQLGRRSVGSFATHKEKGKDTKTMGTIIKAEPPANEARRPFRVPRTGRPGGSGAQPPLHLISMANVA